MTFRSTYSACKTHRKKCGPDDTEYVYDLVSPTVMGGGNAYAAILAVQKELDRRSVDVGCGEVWYTCDSDAADQAADHLIRKCVKQVKVVSDFDGQTYYHTCPDSFRRCMGHTRKHTTSKQTEHSDVADISDTSNKVSPSASLSGSSSASAGGSVTIGLSTTTAFSKVYWYVAGPGDSSLGTNVETDTGGSSSTTESFTYTIPSSASSGDTYTVTAYIYNYSDNSIYQESYSVSVSGSSSSYTPPSDTTPSPPSYTPPSTPSTPPPPAKVSCAHSNCTEMVSSRTSHRESCGSGQHYYWPGCPNNTNWWSQDSTHALKTCRRVGCSNTWRRCLTPTPSCPISGTKCWAQ